MYVLRDLDSGITTTVSTADLAEAEEYARAWAVDWIGNAEREEAGREGLPIVMRVAIEDESGEELSHIVETVRPLYPACGDGGLTEDPNEHEWDSPYEIVGGIRENPGVWGHGAGVRIIEVCSRCGAQREIDTWADDGRGGHTCSERILPLAEWADDDDLRQRVESWMKEKAEA